MPLLGQTSFARPLYVVGSSQPDSCIFIAHVRSVAPKVGNFCCTIGWFSMVAKILRQALDMLPTEY